MLSTSKLSLHAFSQSKAREARHAIPACSSLDNLSQHAVGQSKAREARHVILACSESQSQHGKARHYLSIHSASMLFWHTLHKLTCIKEAAKSQNSRQADTAIHCTTRRTRTREAAEQAATTPWKTGKEAWGIGLHQLSWGLEDQ